jgi:hypothetical protein
MSLRKAIGFLRATAVCIGVASVLTDGAVAEEPVPSVSGLRVRASRRPLDRRTSGGAGNMPAAPPKPKQSSAPTAQAELAVVIPKGRPTIVTRDRPLHWILAKISRDGHFAIHDNREWISSSTSMTQERRCLRPLRSSIF